MQRLPDLEWTLYSFTYKHSHTYTLPPQSWFSNFLLILGHDEYIFVVYFDQLSGAAPTRKLVELLYMSPILNANLSALITNLEQRLEMITKWLRESELVVNESKTEICLFHKKMILNWNRNYKWSNNTNQFKQCR